MEKVVYTISSDQLNTDLINKAFSRVINDYLVSLLVISRTIMNEATDDLNRETRTFNDVKKELFDFLLKHKQFYKLYMITVMSKDEALFILNINDLENGEKMFKLEDIVKIDEIYRKAIKPKFYFKIDQVEAEVIKTIKNKLGISGITNKCIPKFLYNHFLVDKNDLKTKCSNYDELTAFIDIRTDSYYNRKVSIHHISQMAFKFQGAIRNFEDEISCGVCLEDYEENQEICRLPCNHFCCRQCTEEMFAVPEDGSKAHFQCPICRDDCT